MKKVLLLSLLWGCASQAQWMRPGQLGEITAVPNRARLVFVRPSAFGERTECIILDDQKQYLGHSRSQSHHLVDVEPGPRTLYAWPGRYGDYVSPLRATLEAGKVYYVKVRPRPSQPYVHYHLTALREGDKEWPKLKAWLQTPRYGLDREAGQKWFEEEYSASVVIARGEKRWTKLTAEEQAARTFGTVTASVSTDTPPE